MATPAPPTPPPSTKPTIPAEEQLAWLYVFRTLDVVIDAAEAMAKDRRTNPQRYKGVNKTAIQTLCSYARLGTEEEWLDHKERAGIYAAYLGPSDMSSAAKNTDDDFLADTLRLRQAAAQWVNPSTNVVDPLKHAFRTLAEEFRKSYSARWGKVLEADVGYLETLFDKSANLFKEAQIYALFENHSPGGKWPMEPNRESVELAKAIGAKLRDNLEPAAQDSLERFARLQRSAQKGYETIKTIMDPASDLTKDATLEPLMRTADEWNKAVSGR